MPDQALYRFYAADDALLYVGITCDIGHRFAQHSDGRPWWSEVVRCTVERFPDRKAVRAAELEAIQTEGPRYNIRMGRTGGRRTAAVAEVPEEEHGDRLSAVIGAELQPGSLVGSFFHGTVDRQWQGCVVAEPQPGLYLVELFEWVVGVPSVQKLVRADEMMDWRFYDYSSWMRNDYDLHLWREWERPVSEDDRG